MRQRLEVGLRLHQRGHRLRGRDGVHQAGSRRERSARRHPNGAGHPCISTDDDDPAACALVVRGVEPGAATPRRRGP